MKRLLLALSILVGSAVITFQVLAECGSYFQPESPANTPSQE